MTKETDFNQHVDVFNKITMELDSLELKTKEEDKALHLLVSSPSSFDGIVTTPMVGKETSKLDEVIATLLMNKPDQGLK